jgi:hypothetical protein
MSLQTIRSAKPFAIARPQMDPSLRLHIYGRLRPLKPRNWIERLLQR